MSTVPSTAVWRGRQVTAAVLVVAGILLARTGVDLGYQTKSAPGPGFFPVWVGIALAALGAIWFMVLLLPTHGGPTDDADRDLERRGWWRVGRILLALVALALLFIPLGFNLSVLAFLLFLMFTMGRGHAVAKVLTAVAGSFGVYLAFELGLQIQLPYSGIAVLYALGL